MRGAELAVLEVGHAGDAPVGGGGGGGGHFFLFLLQGVERGRRRKKKKGADGVSLLSGEKFEIDFPLFDAVFSVPVRVALFFIYARA